LQEPDEAADALAALDELRATQEECDEFFGGIFDELQTLSLELFARHKCLETSAAPKDASSPDDESLAACRDDFRRAVEQLQHLSSSIDNQLARLTAAAADVTVAKAHPPPESTNRVRET
jgi:hypothetical protein